MILVALFVFTFFYTSNRLFSSSMPAAPIPRPDSPPAAAAPAPASPPVNNVVKPEAPQQPPAAAPKPAQKKKPDGGKARGEADKPMTYGTGHRPNFEGGGALVTMGALAPETRPTTTNGKRLVIVGDVHGMVAPLQALLAKVSFDAEGGKDHLVFVGNMISKGPESAAVVSLAMSLGASSVRGVHEDRVLLANDVLNRTDSDTPAHDNLEQEHLAHGDYDERVVAETLSQEQIDWLASHPVILDAGAVPGAQRLLVAHAGLVPGLPLELQDPWPAMHMRSVVYPREQVRLKSATKKINDMLKKKGQNDGGGAVAKKAKDALIDKEFVDTSKATDRELFVPVDDYSGDEWSRLWNVAEAAKPAGQRLSVVYGHDIKLGLNVGKYSYGINTNCVSGGKLTALVISGSSSYQTVQVDCDGEAGIKTEEIPL